MRDINAIVIHCAYTPPSMDIGAEEITRWHVQENGWLDIGYHYVIRRDGTVEPGRSEDRVGAHVLGSNDNTIGVCLVGGKHDSDQQADCNFTAAQWRALHALVTDLTARYPLAVVCGHRDYNPGRACPTFDARAWWHGEVAE